MTSLLFIKHKSFNPRTVDNDVAILSDQFKVKLYNVNTTKGIRFFTALILQFLHLIFNIYRYKVLFIWFADYHSLLPVFFSKLLGKVCLINIGGYDADEILIGKPYSLKSGFRKFCVKYSVKNASKLFPVSNVIKSHLETAVSSEKCSTIYCCIDNKKFPVPEQIPSKENVILTVGGGGEYVKEAKRKRLDFFIGLADEFDKRFPDYNAKFLLIGHNEGSGTYNYLSGLIKSPNVILKPSTKSVAELIEYYKRASIYMQLSYYEAFGIAQAEAMLYGCIPISNNGGAISEVVANAGFVLNGFNIEQYITLIKEVLDGKHEAIRMKAIHRASTLFSLQNRKTKLLEEINKLL